MDMHKVAEEQQKPQGPQPAPRCEANHPITRTDLLLVRRGPQGYMPLRGMDDSGAFPWESPLYWGEQLIRMLQARLRDNGSIVAVFAGSARSGIAQHNTGLHRRS